MSPEIRTIPQFEQEKRRFEMNLNSQKEYIEMLENALVREIRERNAREEHQRMIYSIDNEVD